MNLWMVEWEVMVLVAWWERGLHVLKQRNKFADKGKGFTKVFARA